MFTGFPFSFSSCLCIYRPWDCSWDSLFDFVAASPFLGSVWTSANEQCPNIRVHLYRCTSGIVFSSQEKKPSGATSTFLWVCVSTSCSKLASY